MSRLLTSNGWTQSPQAEGWTVNNTVGIDTANPRVPNGAAFSISAASSWLQFGFTGAISTAYSLRCQLRPAANPTSVVGAMLFKAGATAIGEIDIGTLGQITLRLNTVTKVTAGTAINLAQYNMLELRLDYPASGAATMSFRVNGLLIGSATGSASLPTLAVVGNGFGSALGTTFLFTDIALNDSNGANQNGWPDVGFVSFCIPTSDNARTGWADGAGGTTALFDALNNAPPVGVGASPTASSQIKDGASNTTDTYKANVGAYTDAVSAGGAGMSANGTVSLVQAIANGGHAATVVNYTLAVAGVSNPAIAEATLNPASTAAGTYPTAWTPLFSAPQYNPAVTLGTKPVLQIRKGSANINAEYYDLLGLMVEWIPATYTDTGAGTLAVTGTATEARVDGDSGAGALAVSGLDTESRTNSDAGSGTLARAGSAAEAHTHVDTKSGTLAVSGTATEHRTYSDTGSGALARGGTDTEVNSHAYTDTGSGTLGIAGSAVEQRVYGDSRFFIDPATLTGRALDLDASQLTGLSDGDPMSMWTDESGSTTLSLNPDDTSQPAFREGVQNGLPGVYFDGHSGFVLTPPVDVAVADGWCVFWVLRPDDPMPQGYGNVLTNNGSTGFWIEHNDPPLVSRLAYYSDAGDFYTFTSVNPLGATQVSTAAVATDGTMQLSVDGVLAATDVGVGENETFDGIGSDNMIPFPGHPDYDAYGGYMFRVVAFDRQLTPDEIAGVQVFLAQEWLGVPPGSGSATENRLYTDSGTGALSATGTSAEAHSVADVRSGGLSVSGSHTEARINTDAGSLTLNVTGTASESYGAGYVDSATGGLVLSGSSIDGYTRRDTGAGSLVLFGIATISRIGSDTGAGLLVLYGSSRERWFIVFDRATAETVRDRRVTNVRVLDRKTTSISVRDEHTTAVRVRDSS